MRAIIIHPANCNNPGDLLTYFGTKNILKAAIPELEILQFDIQRAEREIDTYVPEFHWGDPVDLIVIAGSPWLGVNRNNSKLKMLQQAKARWPNAKTLAFGVGSFYRYSNLFRGDYGDGKNETADDAYAVARNFADFDLVLVRDQMGAKVMQEAGVKAELYYDTSIFCENFMDIEPIRGRDCILVYKDPLKSDAWSHLPEYLWDEYNQLQVKWATKYNAEVIVTNSEDKESADNLGLIARLVSDVEWLAGRYSTATRFISPMVHQCILAKIMGCNSVEILPIDSRYLTATNLGIPILQPDVKGKIKNLQDGRISGIVDNETHYLFPQGEPNNSLLNLSWLHQGVYMTELVLFINTILGRERKVSNDS